LADTAPMTIVSLSFDDTFPDQFQVAAMLAQRGLNATFFVNSGRINASGYMTQGQVLSIQAQGNEIAGHTISHPDLPTISIDEQQRQICNDRVALLALGFPVTDFAYPYGDATAQTEAIAQACGYNSARGVGDLVTPTSCTGCAYANPIPPVDAFYLKTPDSIEIDTTLAVMEGYVTQAEQHGGGWVPLVFHHVCEGCDPLSVTPENLGAFLDWLAARQAQGTVVETIAQVIGGPLNPGVPGPPASPLPSGGNLIQNPSFEDPLPPDGIPTCWQHGASGSNTATFSQVEGADGAIAERIDVTQFVTGARRLVTQQDTGECAPTAYPGHSYAIAASYLADTAPRYTIYYRNSEGGWVYFTQSPTFATTGSNSDVPFATATYTTPALPAGATGISVGLSIYDVGFLVMDNYVMTDTDTTPPVVALTAPGDGATVGGTVTVSATATDAGGMDHVDFLVAGNVVGTAPAAGSGTTFSIQWNTATVADGDVGLVARAVDLAGNVSLSTGELLTISNTPPPDTTPPSVALTSPSNGAVVTGMVALAANASDNVAVQHVDFFADGALVASADAPPYTASWNSASVGAGSAVLTAVATDTSGNATTSAAVTVTVDDAAPTVAIAQPTAGTTVSGAITIAASVSSAVSIAQVQLLVNGAPIGTVTSSPYQVSWNTTAVPDGTVTLTAVATDVAGLTTTSVPVQITLSNGTVTDTTPPVSTIACNGAACGSGYSDQPVMVTLSATDVGTGVAYIVYSVDGSVPDPVAGTHYAGPFVVAATTTVTYRAIDNAGNVEAPNAQVILVDTTTPAIAVSCNGSACATTYYDAPVTVTLAGTDAISGVASMSYALGSAAAVPYAGPFQVAATTQVTATAVDNAGSASPPVAVAVLVDMTAPTVTIECNGVACVSPLSNAPIAITLTATSGGPSGVAAVRYTLDGSTPTPTNGTTYTDPFIVSTTATVSYAAFSGAGASSVVGSQLVTIDTVPPTAAVASPANGASVTGISPIVATVSDPIGVSRVRFFLDGVQLGTRIVTPFKWNWNTATTTPGTHVIAVEADDAAGNATRSASITVTVVQ
jgi:hypothetical protein